MPKFRKALTRFDDYYDMLADQVRMRAYEQAIAAALQPGDVVIDLGAGLGILSFLAVKAGASKVYAIEKSDAIDLARAVAQHNGMQDRVQFVAKNSRDFELAPAERADLIISETLGSFALEENTLEFMIDARQRLLKEGGRLLPQALRMWLVPVEASKQHAQLSFWKNICGIDYQPAIDAMLGRMSVASFEAEQFLAAPLLFDEVDLMTQSSAQIEKRLLFVLERSGTIHGIAGWFEALLVPGVQISTAPDAPPTHWQQAFFPFREAIEVVQGDLLELRLRVRALSEKADDSLISYEYRCTQKARERAETPKPGRNEPCPCGSGKKFKRCCGARP